MLHWYREDLLKEMYATYRTITQVKLALAGKTPVGTLEVTRFNHGLPVRKVFFPIDSGAPQLELQTEDPTTTKPNHHKARV